MVEMRQRIDRGDTDREVEETIQVRVGSDQSCCQILTLLGDV